MNEMKEYSIIFRKLADLIKEEEGATVSSDNNTPVSIIPQNEFDEIDELRRLSEELSDPLPVFFTQT